MKIAIIGVGHVGSTIAYSLIPHCKILYLMDIDRARLEGEFRDLRHAAYFINNKCEIIKGHYKDTRYCDYVIICVGHSRGKAKKDMNKIFDINLPVVRNIINKFTKKFNKEILIVTNPPKEITEALYAEHNLYPKMTPISETLDRARSNIDNKSGMYILLRKGYTNWGIAAAVTMYIMRHGLK